MYSDLWLGKGKYTQILPLWLVCAVFLFIFGVSFALIKSGFSFRDSAVKEKQTDTVDRVPLSYDGLLDVVVSDGSFPVTVVRWVDADTVDVDVELGLSVVMTNVRLRLPGVDAYEVRGEERERGLAAVAFAEALLPVGTKTMLVTDGKRGKYGRLIADLVCDESGLLMTKALVDAGHAVEKEY